VRPRAFVGSSKEGLSLAYAIQENLQHDAEVTVWPQGIFAPSKTALASLSDQLQRSDFGVFVFSPDDLLTLRRKAMAAVRDNVVFELGLFAGHLGVPRVFFVVPQGTKKSRIPTDLVGITPGSYDAKREDRNHQAALGPFCNHIRRAL
jgi:predicted nucleotide-binding protein